MSVPVSIGDTVAGRYRIERELGKGGMGVVFAARHIHLDEPVAIKFPLPQAMMRRDLIARVVREGRSAVRLRSEHVARVMDVGTLDSGEPFIVFELLRGKDLETVLGTTGKLKVDDALLYVLQACEALAEAHSHGIVHRDLKPSNLFLTRRPDGTASIKIIDFGIAKASTGSSGPEGDAATESFMIFGTPLYMSPEQMRSSKDVDARSDLWSLGAVLHHLLAGSPPFPPKSLPEIYQLAQAGAPPICSLRPDVPEAVEKAILRCLMPNPEQRFQNVGEFAEALATGGPTTLITSADRSRRILRESAQAAKSSEEAAAAKSSYAESTTEEPVSAAKQQRKKPLFEGNFDTTLEAGTPPANLDRPSNGDAVVHISPTPSRVHIGETRSSNRESRAPGARKRFFSVWTAVALVIAVGAVLTVILLGKPQESPGIDPGASNPTSTVREPPPPVIIVATGTADPMPTAPTTATATTTTTATASARAVPTLTPSTSAVRPKTSVSTTKTPPSSGAAGPLDNPD